MADTPQTGVTPAGGRSTRGGRGFKGFYKRNKAVVLGGGALGAFLLMSHKGSTASGSNSADQATAALQAQSDQIAAERSALEAATPTPGGFGGLDGGGGTSASGSPLVGDPGAASGAGGDSGSLPAATTSDATAGPQLSITINQAGKKGGKRSKSKNKGKAHPKGKTSGQHKRGVPSHKGGTHPHGKPAVRPKVAARGKPAPASKQGGHPNTAHRTPHGRKRRSPAEVESMFGVGAGVVVMGREFPGALGHRMGPPMRAPDGGVCRRVIVDYGGRTEQHTVHGNGQTWTDNTLGVNPPSRGVPFESAAVAI